MGDHDTKVAEPRDVETPEAVETSSDAFEQLVLRVSVLEEKLEHLSREHAGAPGQQPVAGPLPPRAQRQGVHAAALHEAGHRPPMPGP